MRLYALHKRQFVGVFAVFFICLFITLLIGIAGPSVIQSKNYQPETEPKQIVNSRNTFFQTFSLYLVWSIFTKI
jgi:hypothetical protein